MENLFSESGKYTQASHDLSEEIGDQIEKIFDKSIDKHPFDEVFGLLKNLAFDTCIIFSEISDQENYSQMSMAEIKELNKDVNQALCPIFEKWSKKYNPRIIGAQVCLGASDIEDQLMVMRNEDVKTQIMLETMEELLTPGDLGE